VPPAPPVASAERPPLGPGMNGQARTIEGQLGQPTQPPPAHREIPMPPRRASTTIDSLEKEFQRKKARELEAAQFAGSGGAAEAAQRRTGDKVGRNDPCPCGSGKKYKKCHGVDS